MKRYLSNGLKISSVLFAVTLTSMIVSTAWADTPYFENVASSAGVANTGSGNGAAWIDYDNDGDLDLYLVNDPGSGGFYRNNLIETGSATFTSISVGVTGNGNHLETADYDNDGNMDVLLGRGRGRNAILYRNAGNGTFVDVTASSGISVIPSTNCVWGDYYDQDGKADLYFGEAGILYKNNGDGTFTDLTSEAFAAPPPSNAVPAWIDYDNDGYDDLFLAPASSDMILYHNKGDGTFEDVSSLAGIDLPSKGGRIAVGDYNGDTYNDIYFFGGDNSYNYLFSNDADGTFSEVALVAGVKETEDDGTNGGVEFLDFDLDGDLDLFANGGRYGSNNFFENNGDGTFTDITPLTGLSNTDDTHAIAVGDFDGDGYPDIYEINFTGHGSSANKLFLNTITEELPTIYYVDGANGSDDNDGLSPEMAFATIQKGVDAAQNGNTVLVYPAVYNEAINFDGKAITVQGAATAAGIAVLEAPMDYAVSFYTWEEHNSVLKNFVIRDSYLAVFIAGASPTISNLTVVNNEFGIAAYAGSEPDISNSIFWNNTGGDLFQCEARYICIEEGGQGEGNIDADPCFVDPCNGDYHLKSFGWRWDSDANEWAWDDVTSRCIDAGNPGSPLGDEPITLDVDPLNRLGENIRINMGAYGGTAEASMPPYDWTLLSDITNDGIVDCVDLGYWVENWLSSGSELPSDLNRNGVVDMFDFALFGQDWLLQTSWYEPPTDDEGGPGKPGLAGYYVAYDNPIEPNAPGYALPLNLADVENYAAMDSLFGLETSESLLVQNGFAIIEYDFQMPEDDGDDIVTPYEYLVNMDVPLFITADTLLHLYHIQFDETLKDVEEREFYGDIRTLTAALLNNTLALYEEYTGDLQEAALRNVAYLSVAQQLIEPEASVPELVADVVASELAKIDAHAGFANSDIFIYLEDYSQYVPRGHYTRSEQLKRYFRTLMWYGRMAFLLKGAEDWGPMGEALISVYDAKIQTMQAVLLAKSIEQVQVGERTGSEVWDRMYAVTAFYVGLADDLTPYEYLGALNKVFGSSFVPTALEDEDNFFALKVELSLLRSPEIFGGTGNVFVTPPVTPESLDEVLDKTKGMRFMGQRFIPDSYMFQHLVFPEVLDYTGDGDPVPFTLGDTGGGLARCYPRGLDVMAILGSAHAETILAAEGDTDYVDYALRFDELKAKFDAFDISDWNRNLYWGWLYSLRALLDEFSEGYPNFMRTQAWEKKELNAALASWAELRHDTILYAKQSYTPWTTSVPPSVTGYVEPVPEFYGRLLALTRMTREGLSDLDALSPQAAERLINLENILTRLIEIANKELMNQELSDDDYDYIMGFGETLEGAVIGVEEQGVKTTLVADVHTHGVEQQVLEEGVGYVDLIIVACPIPDGSIVLSAGPILSYYEFKHPMSDRLTDEAWRELLDSPQKPDRPTWFRPFVH